MSRDNWGNDDGEEEKPFKLSAYHIFLLLGAIICVILLINEVIKNAPVP